MCRDCGWRICISLGRAILAATLQSSPRSFTQCVHFMQRRVCILRVLLSEQVAIQKAHILQGYMKMFDGSASVLLRTDCDKAYWYWWSYHKPYGSVLFCLIRSPSHLVQWRLFLAKYAKDCNSEGQCCTFLFGNGPLYSMGLYSKSECQGYHRQMTQVQVITVSSSNYTWMQIIFVIFIPPQQSPKRGILNYLLLSCVYIYFDFLKSCLNLIWLCP